MLNPIKSAGYCIIAPYIEGAKDIREGFSPTQPRTTLERIKLVAYVLIFKMIPILNYAAAFIPFAAAKLSRPKTEMPLNAGKTAEMPAIKAIPVPEPKEENIKQKGTVVRFADGVKPGETSAYDKAKLETVLPNNKLKKPTSPHTNPSIPEYNEATFCALLVKHFSVYVLLWAVEKYVFQFFQPAEPAPSLIPYTCFYQNVTYCTC